MSTSVHKGWELERGDWRAIPEPGLLLNAGRHSLREEEGRNLQHGMRLEENQITMETGHYG